MLQRLFFLNGEQDLSSFVLLDLGIIKYPTYKCIDSDQIFSDRAKLLAYEEVFYFSILQNKKGTCLSIQYLKASITGH